MEAKAAGFRHISSPPSLPTPVEQRAASSLSTPEAWLLELFGVQPSLSGVTITPGNAMSVPAVRNAVLAISEAAGASPLDIYKIDVDGLRSLVRGSPLLSLLNTAANPWTPGPAFREALVRDALLHGRGLALIVRDGEGAARELHRLLPGTVSVDRDQSTGEPIYRINGGNVVSHHDVIDLRGPLADDGISARSPVHDCREAIGLALVLEQHAAKLFGNGARPSGVLSVKGALREGTLANIRAAWQAAHGGGKSGGTAVLDADTSYSPLTMTSTDAQFQELRAQQTVEIARAFKISPALIGDMSKMTFANATELTRNFLTMTLRPWLIRIESELALKLLPDDERAQLAFEHDTDDLSLPGLEARGTAYQALRSSGVMTANEIRRWEGLPPLPDGDELASPHVQSPDAAPKPDKQEPLADA